MRLPHAALLALPFLALYLAFGQSTFYREDGFQLVYTWMSLGNLVHDVHPLYLPVVDAFHRALAPFGVGLYRSMVVFSGLCAAIGVFLTGVLAVRMRLDAARAAWFVSLVGFCPAVFFFATVVEFHAFFFPFAVLSFVTAEGLVRLEAGQKSALRWWLPALLAGTTLLASLAHSSGHLLVPLIGAWVAGRAGLRGRFTALAVFAALHVAGLLFVFPLLLEAWLGIAAQSGQDAGASRLAAWMGEWLAFDRAGERALVVLLREVGLHYLPLSLVFVTPWLRRPSSWRVACFAAGFAPYFALCVFVLADREDRSAIHEWGSYLLPLAIPAAAVWVWALPSQRVRAWNVLIAVALLSSLAHVKIHDRQPSAAYGQQVRNLVTDSETFAFLGAQEVPYMLIEVPRVRPVMLIDVLKIAGSGLDAAIAALRHEVQSVLDRGGRVWLSAGARADLERPEFAAIGKRILAGLTQGFSIERLESGDFRAEELRRP